MNLTTPAPNTKERAERDGDTTTRTIWTDHPMHLRFAGCVHGSIAWAAAWIAVGIAIAGAGWPS